MRGRLAPVAISVLMLGLWNGGLGWCQDAAPQPPAPGTSQASGGAPPAQPQDPTALAIRMMEEVKQREKELAAREEGIRRKEEKLQELERELLDRINKLMALEKKLTQEEEEKLQQLAKVFESSPPEQGGRLLSGLDPQTAARVLERMNGRKAGRLWAYVDPQRAATISEILVKREK